MDNWLLKKRLEALSNWKVLAFGLFLVERMVPNFLQFQAESGAPGGAILQGALAKAWAHLEGIRPDIFDSITEETCAAVGPETEDSTSPYTSAALDAANGAASLLSYIATGNVDEIVGTAILSLDSVSMFAESAANELDESASLAIQTHPSVEQENIRQDRDLGFLESLGDEREELWRTIVRRVLDEGYRDCWLRAD